MTTSRVMILRAMLLCSHRTVSVILTAPFILVMTRTIGMLLAVSTLRLHLLSLPGFNQSHHGIQAFHEYLTLVMRAIVTVYTSLILEVSMVNHELNFTPLQHHQAL